MRAGFAIIALGGIGDIAYHVVLGIHPHGHAQGFDLPLLIHLVVAFGMALSLAGLLREGFRSIRRRTPAEGGS